MLTEITAPITSVTVFPGHARITRSAELALSNGETVLFLSGLPDVMVTDSVRVSGFGAGVTIRGVDVKPDVLAENTDINRTVLREEIAVLEQQSTEFRHHHQTLEARLEYFKSLQQQTGESSAESLLSESTSFERVTAIADYVQEQMHATHASMRDVRQQWQEAHIAWQAAKFRLNDDSNTKTPHGQAIHIAIDTEAATEFTISVEYIVKNAAWLPVYDLRLQEDNQVELIYMAQISQHTGENWNDVSITLSTARPASNTTLPKLNAWYVYDVSSEPEFGARHRASQERLVEVRKQALFLEEARNLSPEATKPAPPPKAKVQQTTIAPSSSGAIVNYRVGTPITVPGNGEPHKTTVTITGLKAELDYFTVPRIASEAYLRATITNTSEYTLLPGEASIFHENDFVGKTKLTTIAANEEFKVQLGVDDRIKIERELVKREVNTRLIGAMVQTHYRYEIRLTNLQSKAAKITVQDQYPVSRSNKINVKLAQTHPPHDNETELKIITWELDLTPDSKEVISLEFIVEHGRNQSVSGIRD